MSTVSESASIRPGSYRTRVTGATAARRGRTTRQWLWAGVAGALTVLILLGILSAWIFARTSEYTDAVVGRATPVLIEAIRLEAALVNEETGIRGYGLTGQRAFLQPYTDGLVQQSTAAEQMQTLAAGDPADLADLDAVLAAADAWDTGFARQIAAAGPDTAQRLAAEDSAQGKTLFDGLRSAIATQQSHLQASRDAAHNALQRFAILRDGVFSAVAVVILLLATLVFEGLRRGVTRPLATLAADARQVADGDLDHPIAANGPADLRELAEDVEAMRRRLIGELRAADEARRQLDEQAVELQRSNGDLEQFAYVASHDLQEPLRKVASFCQLLQRRYAGRLDERADQYIAYAVDGANRMQALIQDLLAFSRVGRSGESHVDVDLEQVLALTTDALSVAVEEAGAVITHDPLPTVTGDPTQLSLLLQNLISNAVKFRDPARTPRVHISAAPAHDRWNFAVTDNGIGIEPAYADRVFTIFQRLHAKGAYPGNGIGLAVCRKILDFHGGEIAVDPDQPVGTRITFTLPLPVQPDGDQVSDPPVPAEDRRP